MKSSPHFQTRADKIQGSHGDTKTPVSLAFYDKVHAAISRTGKAWRYYKVHPVLRPTSPPYKTCPLPYRGLKQQCGTAHITPRISNTTEKLQTMDGKSPAQWLK